MPSVSVNGTELYFEVRGTGPPVLLIMGATGDGGHLDAFADLLADEFTVVSYDRRGNGRSPVPPGWRTTSPEEQADDAAALLNALGTGPAAVFGTSSGGNFALCLLVRHPAWVRGAILHEPGLYALVDVDAVRAPLRALVQEAMERGGPPAAVERFWCYVAGDDGWDRLTPALQKRLRATASTLFEVELGTYELYLPDEARGLVLNKRAELRNVIRQLDRSVNSVPRHRAEMNATDIRARGLEPRPDDLSERILGRQHENVPGLTGEPALGELRRQMDRQQRLAESRVACQNR
jgi:pimeloyl-ACP methyl ester carboxylesterase